MAEPGDWPWHVALFKEDVHVCDATLVAENWLITTASCFQGYVPLIPTYSIKKLKYLLHYNRLFDFQWLSGNTRDDFLRERLRNKSQFYSKLF